MRSSVPISDRSVGDRTTVDRLLSIYRGNAARQRKSSTYVLHLLIGQADLIDRGGQTSAFVHTVHRTGPMQRVDNDVGRRRQLVVRIATGLDRLIAAAVVQQRVVDFILTNGVHFVDRLAWQTVVVVMMMMMAAGSNDGRRSVDVLFVFQCSPTKAEKDGQRRQRHDRSDRDHQPQTFVVVVIVDVRVVVRVLVLHRTRRVGCVMTTTVLGIAHGRHESIRLRRSGSWLRRRTRFRGQIRTLIAQRTAESGRANAFELVHFVDASSAILTRIGIAFVDVLQTVRAGKAGCADALEIVDQIDATTSVGAGQHFAFVHVDLASIAHVAGPTAASESTDAVHTLAAILARLIGTLVHVVLAVGTAETERASAGVAVVRLVR